LSIGISCTEEAIEDNLGVSRSMEHLLAHTVLYHRHLHFLQQVRNSTPWKRKARFLFIAFLVYQWAKLNEN